jgi:hypothetical protein
MMHLAAAFDHQLAFQQQSTLLALVGLQVITGRCAGGYLKEVEFKILKLKKSIDFGRKSYR